MVNTWTTPVWSLRVMKVKFPCLRCRATQPQMCTWVPTWSRRRVPHPWEREGHCSDSESRGMDLCCCWWSELDTTGLAIGRDDGSEDDEPTMGRDLLECDEKWRILVTEWVLWEERSDLCKREDMQAKEEGEKRSRAPDVAMAGELEPSAHR